MVMFRRFMSGKIQLTIILAAICVSLLYLNHTWNDYGASQERRIQVSLLDLVHEQREETDGRSKIYAFYSKKHDNDMTMASWAVSWADAGWNPVILSSKDAEKHPNFKKLESILETRNIPEKAEAKYLGYVAMAKINGGGWFSELNVLPLNPGKILDLPNNGELTVHVPNLPSLISADKKGWNAFAHLMVNSAQGSVEDALVKLKNGNNAIIRWESRVMSAKQLFSPAFFYRDMCEFTKSAMAIRFAVYDLPRGTFEPNEQTPMAVQWLSLHRARCISPRPIIFTFSDGFSEDKVSRSIKEVNLWKSLWSAAGWEPFVLTLFDARRHPAFSDLQNIFQQRKVPLGPHNEACYLRWLAIVAVGGGWMTDVDTFPLHMPPNKVLPNHGNFTSYERHIPTILSASASEWDRLRNIIQQSLLEHKNQFWSDMLAFQHIYEQYKHPFIYGNDTLPINRIYSSVQSSRPSIDSLQYICPITRNLRAIHFSPFALSQVVASFKLEHAQRYDIIQLWMRNWKDQCYIPIQKV